MMKLSVLKYYLLYFFCFSYLYVMQFSDLKKYMTWETQEHLIIIMRIVLVLYTIISVIHIIAYFAENLTAQKESIELFGKNKLSSFWYNLILPFVAYSVYKYESLTMIFISVVFYFGMKVIVLNHNKHATKAKNDEILRKARQEQAEKVTL